MQQTLFFIMAWKIGLDFQFKKTATIILIKYAPAWYNTLNIYQTLL